MGSQSRPKGSEKDTSTSASTLQDDEIEVVESKTSSGAEPSGSKIEKGPSQAVNESANKDAEKEKDPNLVTWDGPNDPANPKNWAKRRRWTACVLLSLFNFVGPLSSAIIAPALPTMEKDLNTSNTIGVMILSIYMLAFSGSNAFFLIFNTACGFAKTPGQLLAFRFLSGIGGCAAQSIGGAVMGEMFTPLERGQAVSIYSVAPLLGPVVGPVCGGLLAQHASWRWCFWAVSLLDVLVQAGGAACLRETHPPVLLRRKRDALAAATGNERLRTEYDSTRDWTRLLGRSMERPFRMLATQPIVQAMSLYAGYGYGLAFLLSATMPLVWEGRYGQPPSTASLNYLPSSIGVIVMSQVTPRLGNAVYGRLLARAPDGQGRPEFRVPLLFLAGVLTPVGLLWYGWSVEARMHAVMPNVGTVVFTAGTNMTFFCINQYLIDTYTLHAASALGAATVLRGVCGFCIPLFAPSMFQALGFGVGNTILAAVAVVIGFPGAFVVWKWGPEMRAKSLYARK